MTASAVCLVTEMTASAVCLVMDEDLEATYAAYLAATGRGNVLYERAARQFFVRWPDPQMWANEPLAIRLATDKHTRPLLTFLMLHARLRPGYDYLVARKLTPLWRELPGSHHAADLQRFVAATVELGYAQPVARGVGSQVVARLLIQTDRGLDGLQAADLDELVAALVERERRSGVGWRHYRTALHAARTALFHLGVLAVPPPNPHEALRQSFQRRLRDASEPLRPRMVAYLDRLTATHARGTVSGIATRLGHFARHLAMVDPDLGSLAGLDRQRHIESYLTTVAAATRPVDGRPISISERRARIISVNRFLADITEWGWPDAPARQLLFPRDVPRLPRPLPRYLPADVDRQLAAALHASPNRQRALALLLQRACGLRVGELVDLELDCVHEVEGHGVWLKVPLGKLATERMVPIDDETLMLIDELVTLRSPGRPLPHPRNGRPVEFLLTHHGGRVSTSTLQKELRATSLAAGLEPATPHQLRHTYATAMVNAGVPLQTLMVLLGHVSAEMSLRYGRLFDATVRDDYERALSQAKAHLGGPVLPPAQANQLPLAGDWKDAPAIKARMAGGYCIRTPAQGSCAYANICEHCPNYRSDTTFLPILATQKADTEKLAADAQARGWIDEAGRHLQLIERLDALISHNQAS
jgi:integrase